MSYLLPTCLLWSSGRYYYVIRLLVPRIFHHWLLQGRLRETGPKQQPDPCLPDKDGSSHLESSNSPIAAFLSQTTAVKQRLESCEPFPAGWCLTFNVTSYILGHPRLDSCKNYGINHRCQQREFRPHHSTQEQPSSHGNSGFRRWMAIFPSRGITFNVNSLLHRATADQPAEHEDGLENGSWAGRGHHHRLPGLGSA